MIIAENSIKPFITKNLPWFVRQNYHEFVLFLEKYYQWLEQLDSNNAFGVLALLDNFKKFHDIDHTLDQLLPIFKSVYSRLIPDQTVSSTKIFIKHLFDLYSAKGSEDSFKLLVYILTGQKSFLFYPKTLLARSSSMPFGTETFIHVKISILPFEHVFTFEGKTVEISGKHYLITKIIKVFDVFRFYINFEPGDEITNSNVFIDEQWIGYCVPLLSGLHLDWGVEFSNNSPVLIIPSPKEHSRPAIIKATTFKKDIIQTYKINNPGLGYQVGDRIFGFKSGCFVEATVESTHSKGEINTITVQHSDLFDSLPTLTIDSQKGYGASIQWTSQTIGKPLFFEIIDPGNNFPLNSFTHQDQKTQCVFTLYPGYIGTVRRYFSSTNLLGQYNILADNYYYQRFSYEINTEHSPYLNRETIENLLHPIGFKSFFNIWHSSSEESHTEVSNVDISSILSELVFSIYDPSLFFELGFLYEIVKYGDNTFFSPFFGEYNNNELVVANLFQEDVVIEFYQE